MFKDNPLLQQLKQQIEESKPTAEGIVKATEKGFGFLQCDGNKSYFISPPHMKRLMHGDRIKGIVQDKGDKSSVEPDSLIEASISRFIGRVISQPDGRPAVIANHPLINQPINARQAKGLGETLVKHDYVVAKMLRHPLTDNGFFCEITALIARNDDPFATWKATAAEHNLAWDAPEDSSPYCRVKPDVDRTDATAIDFFTIDGASTQDMDDAISIKAQANGWQVTVAIADPSAYISPGSPLDTEAKKRCFTLYLPARTVPMLPNELADDLCSLRESQRRAALCCEFHIDSSGELSAQSRFYTAWVESKHRLTYQQVSDSLKTNNWQQTPLSLVTQLTELSHATKARCKWRSEHAILFADKPDYRFDIGNEGQVLAIHREERGQANKMVEETMIAANICAARALEQHYKFGIFNSHVGFNPSKIPQIMTILQQSAIDMSADEIASFEGFCKLRRIVDKTDNNFLELRLRRMYQFSEYSAHGLPHFGLGEPLYATWTSPIRKYSDLLNHRLLKAMITGEEVHSVLDEALSGLLAQKRRSHKIAERNMADYLYAQYYQQLKETPSELAQIEDISRGGLRVRIDATGATAFIPTSKLHNKQNQLRCDIENGVVMNDLEVVYRLGDNISIRVTEIKMNNNALIAQIS